MEEEDLKGLARDKMTFNDPCVMLWRAVVWMGVGDALGENQNEKSVQSVQTRQRVRTDNLQTRQAYGWLFESDQYLYVCQLADLHPDYAREFYRRAKYNGVKKSEFFRKYYNKLLER